MCTRIGTLNQLVLLQFIIADAAFFENRRWSNDHRVIRRRRRDFSFDRN
jgi:hypothetical protein